MSSDQTHYSKDEARRFITDFLLPEFNDIPKEDKNWTKATEDLIKELGLVQKNKKPTLINFLNKLNPKLLAEHKATVSIEE